MVVDATRRPQTEAPTIRVVHRCGARLALRRQAAPRGHRIGRARGPARGRRPAAGDEPVVEPSIRSNLKSGGPYFFPDPFGGDRNILLAIEDGKVVALSDVLPNTTSCRVRWRGSLDSFVDCHDDKLRSGELARYRTEIGLVGANKGELLIDLRHREPPPNPA